MAVCKFFLQGSCRYGSRCHNEHPGEVTAFQANHHQSRRSDNDHHGRTHQNNRGGRQQAHIQQDDRRRAPPAPAMGRHQVVDNREHHQPHHHQQPGPRPDNRSGGRGTGRQQQPGAPRPKERRERTERRRVRQPSTEPMDWEPTGPEVLFPCYTSGSDTGGSWNSPALAPTSWPSAPAAPAANQQQQQQNGGGFGAVGPGVPGAPAGAKIVGGLFGPGSIGDPTFRLGADVAQELAQRFLWERLAQGDESVLRGSDGRIHLPESRPVYTGPEIL